MYVWINIAFCLWRADQLFAETEAVKTAGIWTTITNKASSAVCILTRIRLALAMTCFLGTNFG